METGSRLGNYEITGRLGAGGMGEVYRARDIRLDRDVAIKTLHGAASADPENTARLEREARTLASLNHPNVGAIYGVEERDGVSYLILEYVEGETLSDRLSGGPLPVGDAVEIAVQVARGLEAAHESGIVHRDLKPGNVMLQPDGTVKVLDFGLAKAVLGDLSEKGQENSPTITVNYTVPGVILGTAAYMSPEQARGQAIDKRTDIWSFGVLLYELLTGGNPFRGETVSDSIGAILHTEPDLDRLPQETPSTVRHVLARCLVRNPDQRLRDVGDARIELTSPIQAAPPSAVIAEEAPAPSRPWSHALVAAAAMLAGAAAFAVWSGGLEEPAPVAWFDLQVDGREETVDVQSTGGVVIAPAGDRIAHISRAHETGTVSLWVRGLGEREGRAAVSGPVVMQPFFSPDGTWIGYFGNGALMKVVVAGGSPIELAPASNPRGASWGSDGSIVFSPNTNSGLLRVSAAGGNIEAVTELDAERRERSHRWPAFVPGRSDLLVFTSETVDQDFSESSIELLDLNSGERRVLVERGSYGSVTTDGTLLFARDSNLYGARLASDFSSLETEPLPVAYGINFSTSNGHATVSVSDSGALILGDRLEIDETLSGLGVSWISLSGEETELDWPPGVVSANPAISPDGKRVAFHTLLSQSRVQIYDLERGVVSTPYPGEYFQQSVVWSPAGNRIAFASTTEDSKIPSLVVAALDSAEPPRKLTTAIVDPHSPSDWSVRDEILFIDRSEETGLDLKIYELTTDEVRDVAATAGDDHSGHFSPDGEWVAFVSDVGGSREVYVTKRGGGRRWQISADQGRSPRWSPEGDALYYLVDAAGFERSLLMRAAFSVDNDVPALSLPEPLTEFTLIQGTNTEMWDLHPDGTRLISIHSKSADTGFAPRVRLALNWFTELNQLLDAAGPS